MPHKQVVSVSGIQNIKLGVKIVTAPSGEADVATVVSFQVIGAPVSKWGPLMELERKGALVTAEFGTVITEEQLAMDLAQPPPAPAIDPANLASHGEESLVDKPAEQLPATGEAAGGTNYTEGADAGGTEVPTGAGAEARVSEGAPDNANEEEATDLATPPDDRTGEPHAYAARRGFGVKRGTCLCGRKKSDPIHNLSLKPRGNGHGDTEADLFPEREGENVA